MTRKIAVLVLPIIVPLAYLTLSQAGTPVPCPNPFNSKNFLWHSIPNVGDVKLYFNPPQYINRAVSESYVRYVPSSIDPAPAPDGSTWGAEGPYWANCFKSGIPGYRYVAPEPGSFEGSVWQVSPPPGDGGGCGGGSGSGGGGGWDQAVRVMTDCGGGGGGSGGGSGAGGGGEYGCFDVYVDGSYQGTWCGWVWME